MLLENKVAIITGAGRGIGKSIALKLASEGCAIAFTDVALTDEVEKTRQEVETLGVVCKAYVSNAADFEQAHQVVEQVMKDFGHLDILVNNAGITRDTLLLRMTEQQWDDVIAVNLKSVFNFIHAVTPIFMRQHAGSIISMSSIVGLQGNAGQSNYAASKAGIIALTKSAAKELGARGIRVNAIAPGFIVSDMTNQIPEDIRNEYMKQIPLRRGGTTEEVANVALFLASDLASYVSGQVIQVDGALA